MKTLSALQPDQAWGVSDAEAARFPTGSALAAALQRDTRTPDQLLQDAPAAQVDLLALMQRAVTAASGPFVIMQAGCDEMPEPSGAGVEGAPRPPRRLTYNSGGRTVTMIDPGPKRGARITTKANIEADGDIRGLTDLARATLEVQTLEDVSRTARALVAQCRKEGRRFSASGWRFVESGALFCMLYVETRTPADAPMVGQVLFKLPGMAAADTATRDLYEAMRDVMPRGDSRPNDVDHLSSEKISRFFRNAAAALCGLKERFQGAMVIYALMAEGLRDHYDTAEIVRAHKNDGDPGLRSQLVAAVQEVFKLALNGHRGAYGRAILASGTDEERALYRALLLERNPKNLPLADWRAPWRPDDPLPANSNGHGGTRADIA